MTEYALALSDDELTRYQHMAERAHRAEADLWTQAGVRAGATVADVGCGPGAVSALLAELVGPSGHVSAVDGSADAVAAARATLAAVGVANVSIAQRDAADTGLEPASFDVVMMRHVLGHNGPDEQRIVDHLATLVRPAGCVYLADGDLTAIRIWPQLPDHEDMVARYVAFHASRGNDLMTGLRLDRLLEAAGLEVLDHRGRFEVIPMVEGTRGPPWAARGAMVESGFADAGDLARWEAMFDGIDAGELRYTLFVAPFCAVARRPG
jgi:2-polyprenyl-3-methyl-5-hydroxy-6-metoxy-1,4-benzoquinol methylase